MLHFTFESAALNTEASTPTFSQDILHGFRVDVFYCSPRDKVLAEKLLSQLPANIVTRLRELPASVNASPGYGVAGLEIRYEDPREKQAAFDLKSILKPSLPVGKGLDMHAVKNQTPNYLSVFVCEK